MQSDLARGLGWVGAVVGPLTVATLVSPFRERRGGSEIALVLLALVIAAVAVLTGGRTAAAATVVAALSFNFLFSPPYLVLKVDSTDDVWPILLLLATGLGIIESGRYRRPTVPGDAAPPNERRANQSRRIERVVNLIDQGLDPRDLTSAVEAELIGLLLVRRCRFEAGEATTPRPRLERNGTVSGRDVAVPFPSEELELPVAVGSHNLGRFVLTPTPGASVPLEHRIVAVILTDHLAAAIASNRPTTPLT